MKRLYVFVPVILVFVLVYAVLSPAISNAEHISENVFRLHILANSDSEEDQELKLHVRDKVLELSKLLYDGCESVSEAAQITQSNASLIKETAQKVLAFYGSDYEVQVSVTKEYFNTRYYDDFKLPAGNYNSLKIIIGEGKGKNWWCVMFPSVCLSGCTDDFSQSLTEEERKMLENDKYIVRFKAVEIYEKFKSMRS